MKTKWTITDPDTNQMFRKIGERKYTYKEDRQTDPDTNEIEVFEIDVDLNDYTLAEMIEDCSTFGYESNEVIGWLGTEQEHLIAECIFELIY